MATKTEKHAVRSTADKLNGGSLIPDKKLRQLYTTMLRWRVLEERACLPAERRRLGPDCAKAEAAAVGCTIDLRKEDVVASARHVQIGMPLHGVPLHPALSKLYKQPGPGEASVKFGPGVEMARRLKKTGNVVVAFLADGSLADSMWHEALNAAGAESLPIVFVRLDKLWEQIGSAKSGGKAEAARLRAEDYGFPRIPVDGHDVVAVYRVAHESIQRARQGGGPTLIDCEPYLPDLHGRNRRREEKRTEKDPIRHMELYLRGKGLFRDSWKNRSIEEFSRKLDAAIGAAQQE